MSDRVARILAATALATSIVSLGLSAFLFLESERHRSEAADLQRAVEALSRPGLPLPMNGPPPTLDLADE